MRALPPLFLLSLLITPELARAGGEVGWGTGSGLILRQSRLLAGQAQLVAVRWTSRTGRSSTVQLDRPVDLFEAPPLLAPAGEWAELTLLVDGPWTLSGRDFAWTLRMPALTVVLDQPVRSTGTTPVSVELLLPEGALPAKIRPGDAAHDALVVALQDGAQAGG